ncbi:hypothetical protein EJB05_05750, partial [Eragrostis curvula]
MHPVPAETQHQQHVPAHEADSGEALYERDIFEYLRSMERAPGRLPAANYMDAAERDDDGLTPARRAALVGWLVSAAECLEIHSRTLHLAVSCLDRFLSSAAAADAVTIAAAALFAAAKYEEVWPPRAKHFVKVSRNGHPFDDGDNRGAACFTKTDLIEAEVVVLEALHHDLSAPTAYTFLEHFLERLRAQQNTKDDDEDLPLLASYIAELGLLDYGMLRFRPSVVAASALLVARLTTRPREPPWGDGGALEAATGYTTAELEECAVALHRLHLHSGDDASGPGYDEINDKYSEKEFNDVYTLLPLEDLVGTMEAVGLIAPRVDSAGDENSAGDVSNKEVAVLIGAIWCVLKGNEEGNNLPRKFVFGEVHRHRMENQEKELLPMVHAGSVRVGQ